MFNRLFNLKSAGIAILAMVTVSFGSSNSARADFFDFLFGPEPCKVGSKYTCDQLDRAKYNVYFYTPEDQERYLGVATNLASARIMSVQYANQLGLKRDAGWQTVFCLKTNNSECEEKH
jgi:hypothetical protein